jgi:phosphate transport system substrate-binding protein
MFEGYGVRSIGPPLPAMRAGVSGVTAAYATRKIAIIKRSTRLAIILVGTVILLATVAGFLSYDSILGQREHVVLSIQGSTTLGDALVPKLAEAFLRDDMRAQTSGFRIAGRDAQGRSIVHVWGTIPGRSGRQVIEIYPSESSSAFECLAASKGRSCDIGMASRPISTHDQDEYPVLRNRRERLDEHVVALDAIAIIVNPQNPVSELSVPQIRAIYSGEIKNWKELGGRDEPIAFYGRDRSSGTYEMFMEKIFGKAAITSSEGPAVPAERQISDSRLIVDAVLHSSNAIGYVSSPLIREAKTLAVSDGSGPAILPTELSVVTEDYPICRRLFLYDWGAPGSMMEAFIRFAIYKPGQTLVEPTPFVELTPRIFSVSPPPNAPAAYKEIASKYSRVGLSFHFSTGGTNETASELDNLANVNILRLRTFLAQHEQIGEDILLIGFSDAKERATSSKHVAQQRAEAIATSLRSVGVIVPSKNVLEFGADLPVASNDTPEGRRRNRRVEAWVRKGLN